MARSTRSKTPMSDARATLPSVFYIGSRALEPGGIPYVVAEIGINFNGDLPLAKQTIEAAARAGADAVKFQTFRAEEFMADREMVYEYTSQGRIVREPAYAMFKRLQLPAAWHAELQAHARACGVEFFSSAADADAVRLLLELQVPVLKIASEDLINLPLLRGIAARRVPVILSTGMADRDEIDQAVGILRDGGCPQLMLLHCVSLYPAPDEQVNLRRIATLCELYGVPVGFSDHTVGCDAAVLAVALRAVLIEKHVTLDRTLPGPDHAFSSDPTELAELVRRVRKAAGQLGSSDLSPSSGERAARQQFRRSVVAAAAIAQDATITRPMLALKRPGTGLAPRELERLIGRRATRAFQPNEPLTWDGVA